MYGPDHRLRGARYFVISAVFVTVLMEAGIMSSSTGVLVILGIGVLISSFLTTFLLLSIWVEKRQKRWLGVGEHRLPRWISGDAIKNQRGDRG